MAGISVRDLERQKTEHQGPVEVVTVIGDGTGGLELGRRYTITKLPPAGWWDEHEIFEI